MFLDYAMTKSLRIKNLEIFANDIEILGGRYF